MLGAVVRSWHRDSRGDPPHLIREELSGKTGDLLVNQIQKSLVLRRLFLLRRQKLQLFLLVFIGAS